MGKRQVKTKMGRVRAEPSEGRGEGEARGERRIVGRGNIYGETGVVFAVAGGRDEAKDILKRTTGGEVAADDFRLAGDAAKTGDRDERNGCVVGGASETRPSGGGGWGELDRASVVGVRDGDE